MAESVKSKLLKAYATLAKKLQQTPTRPKLAKVGISRDQIRHHFGTMENLHDMSKKAYPEYFDTVVDEDRFNKKVFSSLLSEVKKYKRFVITTAVAGISADSKFLASIKTFCKERNALLLILPANNDLVELDPELVAKEHIVFDELQLNSNLYISNIKIDPKMIDPVTGLERIAHANSFIFASPKQRMKLVPTSNITMPHVLMTTGAITPASYQRRNYVNRRIDYIAKHDHVMGALVVEIENSRVFHYRQVQADNNGTFIDKFVEYGPNGSKPVQAAAVIMGDYHSGDTDPAAEKCAKELCALGKPKYLVGHDIHDGRANNHHDKHKMVTKAQKANDNKISLEAEIKAMVQDLNRLTTFAPTLVWVRSNHDEVLHRWLEDAGYKDDPTNHLIGLKLAAAMVEGKDPLRTAVEMYGLKNPGKIKWLSRDEDFKIAGIQLGAHGDKGPNGSRGSLRSMESSYGDSVTGHSHTPQILRGAWAVGTSSKLKLSYNVGPSSWLHAHCIVYANGARQLINVIEGKWCTED